MMFMKRKAEPMLAHRTLLPANDGYPSSTRIDHGITELCAPPLDTHRSAEYSSRAALRVPVQSHTFSKAPMSFPQGSYPAFLRSGQGSRVVDVDGNEYIDFILGLGPVVLGYRHPAVDAAVRAQL